jgi:hypothetical protein
MKKENLFHNNSDENQDFATELRKDRKKEKIATSNDKNGRNLSKPKIKLVCLIAFFCLLLRAVIQGG